QIQRQQAAEDFVVGHFGGVVGPAVGGGDGLVERLVGEVQPGRAGVVEVGQGALPEVGFVAGSGDRASGEAGLFLFRGDDPVDPLRRVEPGLAQFVEAAGGGGDVLGQDVAGQTGRRCLTGDGGGITRRQACREGEGFEGGGRGVARPVFERGAEAQRPEFVEAGMQDAEGVLLCQIPFQSDAERISACLR
ncbi:MAG: hypothetical protein MUE63_13290, partial [Xanthomonadales bacterium]|nr:hypothetical protein [Xanthomonadales bacterium]